MATPILTTSNIPSTLKPTLDLLWGNEQKKKLFWKTMGFKVSSSTDAFEDDQEFAGLGPAPAKAQGAMLQFDTIQQGFAKRYTHVTYGLRFTLSEEAIDDCKYDEAINGTENLSTSLNLTQEFVMNSVFINSFSSSFVGADALSLCNTAHLLPKGGTYSNMFTNALSLSETAIETARANMAQLPDSNGYVVNGYQPKRIVVPPQLLYRAMRILKSEQQNDTANNAINVLKGMGIEIADESSPYLTSTTNWWLVSDIKAGIRVIWRKKPMFREHNTEDNYTCTYSAVERFSAGWTNPRDVYGSNA